MKVVWAPWRMEYIRGDKEDACFLCRAPAEDNDRENGLLARGERAGVILNRYPYNNGHLMVFPYRHLDDITRLDADEHAECMALVSRWIGILRAHMQPDGFNVGLNLGRVAGAGLESHVHWHVVPRWNGDTNFMPVLGNTRVVPQSLLALWDELLAKRDA
jgi:ATP adenylyltransferase